MSLIKRCIELGMKPCAICKTQFKPSGKPDDTADKRTLCRECRIAMHHTEIEPDVCVECGRKLEDDGDVKCKSCSTNPDYYGEDR